MPVSYELILIPLAVLLAFAWWMDKRPELSEALVRGIIALVVTMLALVLIWRAFFLSSLLAMMLAGVAAHAVGTGVAMAFDRPAAQRSLFALGKTLGVSAIGGALMGASIIVFYRSIAHLAPLLHDSNSALLAIASSVTAFIVTAFLAKRLDPSWATHASLLATVAVLVTSVILFSTLHDPPPRDYRVGVENR